MCCEDERQKTEKYIIVIEIIINDNEGESAFSFKRCGMDRQRWRGWNVRIINILFVFISFIFVLRGYTERERGKDEMNDHCNNN